MNVIIYRCITLLVIHYTARTDLPLITIPDLVHLPYIQGCSVRMTIMLYIALLVLHYLFMRLCIVSFGIVKKHSIVSYSIILRYKFGIIHCYHCNIVLLSGPRFCFFSIVL